MCGKKNPEDHAAHFCEKKKMWCIYTMEYYSTITKNEIMPFAATWMDLVIIILSEVKKRKTSII